MTVRESTLNSLGKTLTYNAGILRRLSETTVPELARQTGLSASTLRRIEKARIAKTPYKPMLSTVVKLAAQTGVTIDEFLKGRLVIVPAE